MSARKRLELKGEIPTDVVGVQRIHARHLVIGKDVEIRVASVPGRDGEAAPFVQEMLELSFLDHPVSPPVLDRGVFQGRYYYAVPLRVHRGLDERLDDPGLELGARGEVVRQLANLLSDMHVAGIASPPPDPRELCWEEGQATLRLRHPRLRAEGEPAYLEGVPEEKAPGLRSLGAAGNVRQWAALSYWLLTRGETPFEKDTGAAVPLGSRVEALNPGLARLIDSCLFGEEDERPETGPELVALLRLTPGTLRAAGVAPDEEEAPELDVKTTLHDLRASGKIPKILGALDGGLEAVKEKLQAIELPALEAPESTGKNLAIAAAMVVCLVGGLFLGEEPPPPVRVGETDLEALGVKAEDLRRDPYVASLLKIQSVAQEDFTRLWRMVRTLALQSRLPAGLTDEAAILKMHATFKKDPDGACAELEGLLEKLRVAAGSP